MTQCHYYGAHRLNASGGSDLRSMDVSMCIEKFTVFKFAGIYKCCHTLGAHFKAEFYSVDTIMAQQKGMAALEANPFHSIVTCLKL